MKNLGITIPLLLKIKMVFLQEVFSYTILSEWFFVY